MLILAVACHSLPESATKSDGKSPEIALLDTLSLPAGLHAPGSLKAFYASRNLALFWTEAGRVRPLADSLLQTLSHAHLYGLSSRDYHLQKLAMLIDDTLATGRLEQIDVLFTDAYLALHCHLRNGRLDPATMQPRNTAEKVDVDAVASLQALVNGTLKHELERIEPPWKQYHDLKLALKHLASGPFNDSVKADRLTSLSLNLERWRWEKQWPDRYVIVNIPSFVMRAVEEDSVWLESRVIVGKRKTPTPVMESVITSFIIYPYWHVPRSISTKEILPHLQVDRDYLRRNNFDVLNKQGKVILPDTIQWDLYNVDHFPFVLRQREGSENSMGIIKFNFANRYGVYLHDTNSKRLYSLPRRDLSHGCVRVKDAVALAHYLIREDDVYVSPDDLDQYLSFQQRLTIDLRRPILLKLAYFTAEVQNGAPLFYEDIYKKDSVMMHALDSRWNTDALPGGL